MTSSAGLRVAFRLLQRPFTMDGELGCGTASEPGLSGEERVAPWWIPISFKTAREIESRWAPLDTCASTAPIYTLQASRPDTAPQRRATLRSTGIVSSSAYPSPESDPVPAPLCCTETAPRAQIPVHQCAQRRLSTARRRLPALYQHLTCMVTSAQRFEVDLAPAGG